MRDEVRDRAARAIARYDWAHGISANAEPGAHTYGEVDALLAEPGLFADEMTAELLEANEGLGDALVRINLALSLPASGSAVDVLREIGRLRRIANQHGG